MKRFTIDGSQELEEHLAGICRIVADEILAMVPAKNLEGILLGGGYGRGQGGVLRTPMGDRPYNDLEFYVCFSGVLPLNRRCYQEKLSLLAERLSPQAGVELEFKVSSSAKLARSPVSMFYYDLVMGHQLVWGRANLLQNCEHHRMAKCIPIAEATRLMMNRCSGLLYAQELLDRDSFPPAAADFVCRNIAKTKLAYGDAVLTAFGQYHWDCLERCQRLARIDPEANVPRLTMIRQYYVDGLDFKLHPQRSNETHSVLSILHRQVSALGLQLWLWLEKKRLQRSFETVRDYASDPSDKCPETPFWRNPLVNVRAFGSSILLSPKIRRHPRERLLNTLPLLLWEPGTRSERDLQAFVRKELRTSAWGFSDLLQAYRQLWLQFS